MPCRRGLGTPSVSITTIRGGLRSIGAPMIPGSTARTTMTPGTTTRGITIRGTSPATIHTIDHIIPTTDTMGVTATTPAITHIISHM